MAEINDLNITDASNTARFPENQAPSSVNDGARALEGLIARGLKDIIDGAITTAGTSTAYTVAANRTLTAYYDGLTLCVKWHVASGATPTVNVDSLGAKSLYWPNGTQLTTDDIPINSRAIIQYDGTNFQVLTPSAAISNFARTLLDDATAAAAATTLALGTGDSPQFTAINIGHATDTTVSRSGAGDIAVEGNVVYRAGGTNVPFSDIAQASAASRLVGRGSAAGAGDFQEITLGTGLSMSGTALSVSLTAGFTLGTEQAASGASITFTGIPAGTKQIVIMAEGISSTGTDDFLVQIGDAGGIETTGYVSVGSVAGTTNASSTAGYIINSGGNAAFAIEYTMILSLKDSTNFTWSSFHVGADSGPNVQMGSGTKSLSAELTQVRIAFTGADNFDAGSFNIMYI